MSEKPPVCFLAFIPDPEYARRLEKWCRQVVREVLPERLQDHVKVIPWQNLHLTILYFQSLNQEERSRVWEKYIVPDRPALARVQNLEWERFAVWPRPQRPALFCLETAGYELAAQWKISREKDILVEKGDINHLQEYHPHLTAIRCRASWGAQRLRLPPDLAMPSLPVGLRKASWSGVAFLISNLSAENKFYRRETEIKF
jgi:2'-5' RNA ligase